MAFENKPLRSQWDIVAEKTGVKKKEAEPAKEVPKKTFLEEKWAKIEQQKAELKAAEVKVDQQDKERIAAIGAEFGLDVSGAMARKDAKIQAETVVAQEAVAEAPIVAEEAVVENPQTMAEEIPAGVEELLQREPANNAEALGGVDEAGSVEWHKDQLRQYLEDPVVAKELTPQEMQGFKDSFSEEIDNNPDAEAMEVAMSNRVDNINNFINEKRRQAKMEGGENIEAANQQEELKAEEEPITKEQVQSEALKDFTNELKGIKKNEQWKEDPIMQGMEDFANSFKEKTPMTETLKDMFSFIKKKGVEINSGGLTAKKAIGEFSKKSSEWAKKIFGGAEIGKSKEASRIDRMMAGDTRSDEAVRVDEAMERAQETGEMEKNSVMEKDLEKAQSMDDLIDALNGVDTVSSSEGKTYQALDQQAFIDKLFKTGDKRFLNWLAKGPVKENAKRVFDEEHKKSSAEAKAEKRAA